MTDLRMTYTTKEEFAVLHDLRVKGMSSAEPIALATGLGHIEVQHILDDAVARGLARSRTGGRVQGYMLTSSGRRRHLSLHGDHVSESENAALLLAYLAFLAPNRALKELTTRWQTDSTGVETTLADLEQVHVEVSEVLSGAGEVQPRFQRYQPRLDQALEAFRIGDSDALAKPMSDSYHDVWMELHEDLLVTLGRERTDDDE